MTYDFSRIEARKNKGALKWELMYEENPSLGEDIVPLSVADMEFKTAPEIVRALTNYASEEVLGYTGATDAFYDAVISWQTRRHGWTPKKEWIVLSPGVVPALFHMVRTFTREGEGVIVQPPVYYPFYRAIESAGRTLVSNPLIYKDNRWLIDFEGFEALASKPENTMFILCSPHNPVGRVWTKEELSRLLEICVANDVLLVADEIHNDLIMSSQKHTTLATLANEATLEKLVVCSAPSKTFNLAGCQASTIFIPSQDLRERYKQAWDMLGLPSLNAFAYCATEAAYTHAEGWLDELISQIWDNYLLIRSWAEIKHPELVVSQLEGTYLAWIDFSAWNMSDAELKNFMHKEAQLWLDEGDMFGTYGSGFERFNLACPQEVLEKALGRIDAAADKLHTN